MNNEKMIQTAKTSYTIVNIMEKIMIAALVLCVLGLCLLGYAWAVKAPVTESTISFGNVTFRLSEQYAPTDTIQIKSIMISILSAIVLVGIIFYGLSILKKILRPMKEGRPFDVSVSDGIRKLGYAVLAGGLIRYVTQVLTDYMFRERYELLRSLFKEGAVEHMQVTYSFSIGFLFVALLLFLLSYVFRYGEELQRQSDETL